MTVRTLSELKSQFDTLAPDNTTGLVSPADLRSMLDDIADTLFHEAGGGTPVVGTHTRYFGWSDDQTIESSDLADAATDPTSNSGTLPAPQRETATFSSAVPSAQGYPTQVFLGGFWIESNQRFHTTSGNHHGRQRCLGAWLASATSSRWTLWPGIPLR